MRNRQIKHLAALVVLTMLFTSLAACGPTAEPTEVVAPPPAATEEPAPAATTPPEPTEAPPAAKKVATFIWTQEPDNLNPFYTNMWFSTITQNIWSCDPWVWDEENNPIPVLLTELPSVDNGGISADGTVITLSLRDDIVWSDSEPITSDDFIFTYEMAMEPANVVISTYPYDQLVSMEAPDALTVVMTFSEPFVPWMASFGNEILPAHVLRPVFEAEGNIQTASWNLAPTVGCGPFVFAEWESGSYARFVRNENYYDEPAKIDEIFMRFVPDDASQVAALRTGVGDLGTFISYADIPVLEEAGIEMIAAPSGYNEGIYFYFGEETHPAINDVKVRQAIAMCFDRFSLVEDLLLGATEVAASFWHLTAFQDPDLEPWPYDPVRANALLDEAGWVDSNGDGVRDKDGEELILVHGTTTREIRANTQAVAQQQLAECGIRLEITGYAADVFFRSYGDGGPCPSGELDLCEWSASTSFPDPMTSRFLCAEIPTDDSPEGINDQKLCDPTLEALFQKQQTQVDFAERQATFHEISRYMTENLYWLGVWYDPDIWAVSGRLQNVKISGATPFFNLAEWDLTP
jgi:peptide/nickel transport system substrate-binding protein